MKRNCTSMRRLPVSVPPAAEEPLRLPKPKPSASVFDWPKKGELKFPMGVPKLTWLSRLWARKETTKLYGLSVKAPVDVPPSSPRNGPPELPPDPAPPDAARPPASLACPSRVPPGGGALSCGGAALARAREEPPKPNVLVSRRCTSKKVGPEPKLRGTSGCPGAGFGSKAPKRVTRTPGFVRSVANAGRSAKRVSPFVSRPVTMLKGTPEREVMSGLRLKPQGRLSRPPRIRRWRTSLIERPYSVVRSYELAGKVWGPSVSLDALFRT